jgi:hypothetical protein
LWLISRLPGAMRPLNASYRWIAGNRSCLNRTCNIEKRPRAASWAILPLVTLPLAAWVTAPLIVRNVILPMLAFIGATEGAL